MKIGIGLPNPVSGYREFPGDRFVEWARRAEDRGFASLATIDRLAYGNYDSLATLAAAAGATSRIGLLSNILLGPLYPTSFLAKAAATIDQISQGRFTLGLAPGGREDDYTFAGVDFATRGRAFDDQLDELHRAWRGEPLQDGGPRVSPTPVNDRRVPVLIGGTSAASFRRTTAWAEGFTIGGLPPEHAEGPVQQVSSAWEDAARVGEPRVAALAYFSLGAETEDESRAYLRHYYANLGDYADAIAEGALRSGEAIRTAVHKYRDVGITELYLDPTVSDLSQVDRLADEVQL